MNLEGLVGKRFDQIPSVSEGIAEHHHLAVCLLSGPFQILNSSPFEAGKVAVKIIGFQDKEDAPARLVADGVLLIRRISPGENEAGFAVSGRATTTQRLVGERVVSSTSLKPSFST